MTWTAIIPVKGGDACKSRLAGRLTAPQRAAVNDLMIAHVIDCLWRTPSVSEIVALSTEPWPGVGWAIDRGGGVNEELTALRGSSPRVLVVHGDLPFLDKGDVVHLIEAAERSGVAVAPDRHGQGTNAIALAGASPFAFHFGADSLSRHLSCPGADIVSRCGLAYDVDTPHDYDHAVACGVLPSVEALLSAHAGIVAQEVGCD